MKVMNIHVQLWLFVWGRGVRRTPGGGGGMEAIIKLIYVVEDYTNLMSHSS